MYSDLIDELNAEFGVFKRGKFKNITNKKFNTTTDFYEIKTARQEKIFGKAKGEYAVLNFGDFVGCNTEAYNYYLNQFKGVLKRFLGGIKPSDVVMVVGLGNRHISADSLGAAVVGRLVVTRGFVENLPKVCAISPSVFGLTGIETADIVDAVVNKIKPNIVVFIDALCASHSERLGRSFQLSNVPITPGAGVDNTRKKFKNTPRVVSIGVPFVVYSSTFIKTALAECGLNETDFKEKLPQKQADKYNDIMLKMDEQLVTLKDIEECIGAAGRLIATALNSVILGINKLD